MSEFIEIRGARENNLKNISLRIPKRKITIFTGVSGSGKSSIVFDTIASEAQRQLYENFSLFIRNFLPKYPQPDADAIENLNMAVIVDQKRLGGGRPTSAPHRHLRRDALLLAGGDPSAGVRIGIRSRPRGGSGLRGLGKKVGVVSTIRDRTSRSRGGFKVPFRRWEAQGTRQRFFDKTEAQQVQQGRDGPYAVREGSQVQGQSREDHQPTTRIIGRRSSYVRRDSDAQRAHPESRAAVSETP